MLISRILLRLSGGLKQANNGDISWLTASCNSVLTAITTTTRVSSPMHFKAHVT